MKRCFLVRAYTKTGTYAVEVECSNKVFALNNAYRQLKKMAFGRILEVTIDEVTK